MNIGREDKMKERTRKEGNTSRKLLVSASAVFAAKGYRDATVAEICERAGTNIAAVNYHFGSKEDLYRESWLFTFRASIAAHPPDGGLPVDAPAEERLRGYIVTTLQRAIAEENEEFRIMTKEITQPTGLLDIVAHEAIMPLQQMLEHVIRELIGPEAAEQQVQFCGMSILNQCMHPMVMHIWGHDTVKRHPMPPVIDNIESFAEHVFRFSLAGIYAYRSRQA
jgi:TetR/AcrR family transcriptional regulator, regulator of cefoperazone and chloramphenicol sensitivity